MIISRLMLIVVLLFAAAVTTRADDEQRVDRRPNIIYIMLDDLDYFDLGVYGSPDIHTPNIDAFAAQGMRFDNYYVNGPVCSPTRAALLTGHFPSRYGISRAVEQNSYRGIPGDVTTLGEMLNLAGYRTGHIGKWHVGTNKPEFLPGRKGFDRIVRYNRSAMEEAYSDFELSFDGRPPRRYDGEGHLTGVLTDEALTFIERSASDYPGKPFFLNLWYFAPHDPHEVPADFDNSDTRYCIDRDLENPKCKSSRGNFAALVTDADRQIKRILELLERLALTDDSLVIVTSDNGGTRSTRSDKLLRERPLRGYKTDVFEGGIRVPLIVRWPGVIPENTINDSVVAGFDWFPTLAEIAKAGPRQGLDLDGESFSQILTTNRSKPRSSPLFWEGEWSSVHFDNASGASKTFAVRDRDWKLVYVPDKDMKGRADINLFNLRADPAEQNNLLSGKRGRHQLRLRLSDRTLFDLGKEDLSGALSHYAIASELLNKYYAWRHDVGDIAYRPVPSRSGVDVEHDLLTFDGGVARVGADTRFDFHDGGFSFLTTMTVEDLDGSAIVAEKHASWSIRAS